MVVALTASAMDDDRQTVFESGADSFVAKPCREDEVLERIGNSLNIAYDYESLAGAEGQATDARGEVSAGLIEKLPQDLVEDLRNATLSGNKKLLDKLIVKVRETQNESFASSLQELADKYEYDALTQLLEEVCGR